MDDERCRITVVGRRRRVDLAVPAHAPIAEYVPELTRLCGQETDETFPASWSLALPGARPFPLGVSLLEAQVADGATLYLRDAVEGETEEPVVTDLEDLAEEVRGGWDRWNTRHRVFTTVGIGLAVMVGAVALPALTGPRGPVTAFIAIIAGSVVALLGGSAARRDWAMPGPLRAGVAMAACPLFAFAGYVIPASTSAAAAGTVAGAVIGALAAALAVPDVSTLLAALLAAIALPVAILLAVLHASYAECAAVTGVVALIMLSAAPAVAGRLAALAPAQGRKNTPAEPATEIATVMGRGRGALIALVLTLSLAVVGCLLVLGDSGNLFAVALALCVSLGLLAQAGESEVPVTVMSRLVAGFAGVTTVALRAPVHLLHLRSTSVALLVCAVGAAVFAVGCALASRTTVTEVPEERPSWLGTAGIALVALSVPLAVGVFGVFGDLAHLGGRI
ncbi:type VII secretion integral membrane protein EccD [Actinoallomurus acaciae]|uniref:Type VII secretion integral membrane protein EccD n=1 Tax=Actinoallomurus acaciae TaxID=502577 RepID=A0ABV5YLD9_9ACTN